MKQLTCEMCENTDFLKQDGVFVCQSCGIKYSVEEAKKLMSEGAVQTQETVKVDKTSETENWLKRAYMLLEDEDWNSANVYCEKVLDVDPENVQAYLAKLMIELQVNKQDKLKDCDKPFDNSNNYRKVIRFADDNLKSVLAGYIKHINTRNENDRLEGLYNQAISTIKNAKSKDDCIKAANIFNRIPTYKDSATQIILCQQKAKELEVKAEEEGLITSIKTIQNAILIVLGVLLTLAIIAPAITVILRYEAEFEAMPSLLDIIPTLSVIFIIAAFILIFSLLFLCGNLQDKAQILLSRLSRHNELFIKNKTALDHKIISEREYEKRQKSLLSQQILENNQFFDLFKFLY